MKSSARIAAVLAFPLLASGPLPSAAAPMAYCDLYAREHVELAGGVHTPGVPDSVYDKAFYECLNMDEDPPLPSGKTASAGEPEEQGSASDEAAETTAAVPEPEARPRRKRRGSGLEYGSAEWKEWCARHFPNSFDEATGTIVPYETGQRTKCL